MSQIILEDFQLLSDDEYHEDERGAEANSVHNSVHESNEDEVTDNFTDGDLYGRFSTDYEKSECDDALWGGITNIRKHHKKAKKAKKDTTAEQGKLETQPKPGQRERG